MRSVCNRNRLLRLGRQPYVHTHLLQRGIVDSRDVLFFGSVIGLALFTTGVIIRGLRAG